MSFKIKAVVSSVLSFLVISISVLSVMIPISRTKSKIAHLTETYESQVKSLEEIVSSQSNKIKSLEEDNKKLDKCNKSLVSELKEITSYDPAVYSIPEGHNSFKSYMSYQTLSKNFKGRQIADSGYTDEYGLRRVNGAYCVALGTYYGDVGDTFRITLSTGVQVLVIKCDTKSDNHTDSSHRYTVKSDCMAEFLVDTNNLSKSISSTGDVSTGTELEGSIVSIVKEG